MTPSTRHSRRFRVIGEEDDPAEALEDLKRKKKAEHKRELKKKEEKGSTRLRTDFTVHWTHWLLSTQAEG